jgi:hypothetical protein
MDRGNLISFAESLLGLTGQRALQQHSSCDGDSSRRPDESPPLRPFVCDGDPFDCKAFLVGTNAATDVPFWPFWKPEFGFDKTAWLKCYESRRKGRASATRQRIARIVSAASPAKILETNLFAAPTAREADLKPEDRQSPIFDFLLESLLPSVIVTHGAKARHAFEKRYGTTPAKGDATFVNIDHKGRTIRFCAVRHLSRLSFDFAEQLGSAVRAVLSR